MPKFTELPGASPPGLPPGLCPGPAGGLTAPPRPPAVFFWSLWPRHYQNAFDGPGQEELKHQKDLKMQGTLFGLEFIDYLVSQDIFKNIQWSDQLVQFWYKMRHNVLPCNYTLNIWHKTPPECIIDNYRLESMAHILTSCVEFKDFYSIRHDTIVNKIGSELSAEKVCVNKSVKTALGDLQMEDSILSQKPDIILKDNKNIIILEVSYPSTFMLTKPTKLNMRSTVLS